MVPRQQNNNMLPANRWVDAHHTAINKMLPATEGILIRVNPSVFRLAVVTLDLPHIVTKPKISRRDD